MTTVIFNIFTPTSEGESGEEVLGLPHESALLHLLARGGAAGPVCGDGFRTHHARSSVQPLSGQPGSSAPVACGALPAHPHRIRSVGIRPLVGVVVLALVKGPEMLLRRTLGPHHLYIYTYPTCICLLSLVLLLAYSEAICNQRPLKHRSGANHS